jgi:hypothetical protein
VLIRGKDRFHVLEADPISPLNSGNPLRLNFFHIPEQLSWLEQENILVSSWILIPSVKWSLLMNSEFRNERIWITMSIISGMYRISLSYYT